MTPTTPHQRVSEFLRQWRIPRGRNTAPDFIYGVHFDAGTDNAAELLASDLEALLVDSTAVQLHRIADSLETMTRLRAAEVAHKNGTRGQIEAADAILRAALGSMKGESND